MKDYAKLASSGHSHHNNKEDSLKLTVDSMEDNEFPAEGEHARENPGNDNRSDDAEQDPGQGNAEDEEVSDSNRALVSNSSSSTSSSDSETSSTSEEERYKRAKCRKW